MKIEVGMYVRTNIGEIAKIINSKHYENDTGNYNELITDIRIEKIIYDDKNNEHIIKTSYNLIDLIEVGDFVTYKQCNIHWDIPTRVSGRYNRQRELTELIVNETPLRDVEIISIVTKEQFEREAYKIQKDE